MCLSLSRDRNNLKYWILGSLLFAVTLIPYVRGEIRTHWGNTHALISYFQVIRGSNYYDPIRKSEFIFSFIPNFVEHVLMMETSESLFLGRFIWIGGSLLLAALAARSKDKRLLLFYFISLVLMERLYKGEKIDYYLSTLFILPAYLFGQMISWAGKKLAVLPLILLSFFSGMMLTARPAVRQYPTMVAATEYINSKLSDSGAVVFFHPSLDFLNVFTYGFKYSSLLNFDPLSTNVVEVCDLNYPCGVVAHVCRGITEDRIAMIKSKYHYRLISTKLFSGNYGVAIGKIDAHLEPITYIDSSVRAFRGSDLLMQNFVDR